MTKIPVLLTIMLFSLMLIGCNAVGLGTGIDITELKKQQIQECQKELINIREDGVSSFRECLDQIELRSGSINLEDAKNQAIENILFEEEKDKSISMMQQCLERGNTLIGLASANEQSVTDYCKSLSRKVYKGDHKNLESEEIETDLNVSLKTAETCLEESEEMAIPTTIIGDTKAFRQSLVTNCLKAAETTFDLADGTDNFDEVRAKGSAQNMQSALTDCMNNPNNVKGSISTSRKLAMCQEQTKRAFENAGGSTQKLVPTTSKKISDSTKESNNNAEDIIEKFESRIDDLEEQIEELQNILKELIQ